jgi:hypothetical protein
MLPRDELHGWTPFQRMDETMAWYDHALGSGLSDAMADLNRWVAHVRRGLDPRVSLEGFVQVNLDARGYNAKRVDRCEMKGNFAQTVEAQIEYMMSTLYMDAAMHSLRMFVRVRTASITEVVLSDPSDPLDPSTRGGGAPAREAPRQPGRRGRPGKLKERQEASCLEKRAANVGGSRALNGTRRLPTQSDKKVETKLIDAVLSTIYGSLGTNEKQRAEVRQLLLDARDLPRVVEHQEGSNAEGGDACTLSMDAQWTLICATLEAKFMVSITVYNAAGDVLR